MGFSISSIAFYPIFGYPLIMYGGITTIVLFITTAYLGRKALTHPGPTLRHHMVLAYTALAFAVFHAILGLAFLLGF